MVAKNDAQLAFEIRVIGEKVIKRLEEDIMMVLLRHIDEEVYAVAETNDPRQWYLDNSKIPSYQFRKAFHFDKLEKTANSISKKLFYDWEHRMSVGTKGEGGNYLHTQDGDYREQMAEAFNIDGWVRGEWKSRKREPYWDNTIMELFDDGSLDVLCEMYMIEEFERAGEKHFMYGKHHTEESRRKMSEAKIGKCSGVNNQNAKLSLDDIEEILILLENGETQTSIAKRFSVTQSAIWYVKKRNGENND